MSKLALSLEAVFCGRGLADVPASPLQRAICRVVDGRSVADLLEAIDPDSIRAHFGCEPEALDHEARASLRRVVIIAGIRGGKSKMSCCAAIAACLTADLSQLKPHELPRFAIVGPTVDAARATFVELVGTMQASKVLAKFIEGEPTADTVVIRRPDGRRVELVVVAAHRGGLSVRNRWLVGFVLEEVASFGSEATGAVVNAEEILRAAETRLLPGCQGWLISSPFGPVGLLHDLYQKHFGKPGSTVVVHAPTRALNPSFPQSRIDEIALESPDVAAREYGAEWVDADTAYYHSTLIDNATRKAPLALAGTATCAAMDPATRGNAWTLCVAWSERITDAADRAMARLHSGESADVDFVTTRVKIMLAREWKGSKQAPLSPRQTLAEIAEVLRPYGVSRVYVDGWSFDALQDHARAAGLVLEQHTGDRDLPYKRLKTLLANGAIGLPPHPVLRHDLLSVRQRATSSGAKIHLPRTADGRHCDFAPAVALAAHQAEHAASHPFVVGYEAAPDYRHPPAPRTHGGWEAMLDGDAWDDVDTGYSGSRGRNF